MAEKKPPEWSVKLQHPAIRLQADACPSCQFPEAEGGYCPNCGWTAFVPSCPHCKKGLKK